jgi:hypothetical protein
MGKFTGSREVCKLDPNKELTDVQNSLREGKYMLAKFQNLIPLPPQLTESPTN